MNTNLNNGIANEDLVIDGFSLSPQSDLKQNYEQLNSLLPCQACITVREQPKSKGYRFRYECEGTSHGGIPGENHRRDKPSSPSLELKFLENITRIDIVALLTNSDGQIHQNSLEGSACTDGVYSNESIDFSSGVFSFKGSTILRVKKNLAQDFILRHHNKLNEVLCNHNLDIYTESAKTARQKLFSNNMFYEVSDPRKCHLLFFAIFYCDNTQIRVDAVQTNLISDAKSPDTAPLKICRLSSSTASCTGDEEIFLLCEKVPKTNIQVVFYDNEGWVAYGDFGPADVHHQYAIVFKVPPYKDQDLFCEKKVKLKLARDEDYSDPVDFTYSKSENISIKKRRKVPNNADIPNQPHWNNECNHFDNSNPFEDYTDFVDSQTPSQSTGEFHIADFLSRLGTDLNVEPSHIDGLELQPRGIKQEIQVKEETKVIKSDDQKTNLSDITFLDENGNSMLHHSVLSQNLSAFHQILSDAVEYSGFEAAVLNKQNNDRQTCLHLAVAMENFEMVKTLLNYEANVSILNKDGNSAFHIASTLSNSQILKTLLGRVGDEFDLDQLNFHGFSPIHLAAKNGSLSCVKLLIEHSVNYQLVDGKSGKSILHMAVEINNLEMTKFLINEAFIDINMSTFNGNTALHLAVGRRFFEITKFLVNAGADKYIENFEDRFEPDDSGCEDDVDGLTLNDPKEFSGQRPIDLVFDDPDFVEVLNAQSTSDSVSSDYGSLPTALSSEVEALLSEVKSPPNISQLEEEMKCLDLNVQR